MDRWNGLWKYEDHSHTVSGVTSVSGDLLDETGGSVAELYFGETTNPAALERARANGWLLSKTPQLHRLAVRLAEVKETNPIVVGAILRTLAQEASDLLGEQR